MNSVIAGLEYASCGAFKEVVQWGLYGDDGLFSIVKDEAHRFSPAQEKALQLIHPHACAWSLISADRAGRSTVRASLNVGELFVGLISPEIERPFLEVSWPIAAFAPLTLQQAGSGDGHGGYSLVPLHSPEFEQLAELLLVLRSSMTVILRGGPDRWRQGVEFVDTHEVVDHQGATSKDNLGVTHLQDGRSWVYNIECKNLGTYVRVQS